MYQLTITEKNGTIMFQRAFETAQQAQSVMQMGMRMPTLWGTSTGVIEYIENGGK